MVKYLSAMLNLGFNPQYYKDYEDCCKAHPSLTCKVTLRNGELWKKFHSLGTEMIITKSGRRMFPSLHVQVAELSPRSFYCVVLEMIPVSRNRYKYSSSGGWFPAGSEEPQSPHRLYLHPDSPARGDYWMSQPISFGRLKLTNTIAPPAGQVVLSSMHKYQPRISIVRASDPRQIGWSPSVSTMFEETEFVAVTAYQNEKITKLKIDNNPFAKGFRESGQAKCKRKNISREYENVGNKLKEIRLDPLSPIKIEDDSLSSSSSSVSPSSSSYSSVSPLSCSSSSPLTSSSSSDSPLSSSSSSDTPLSSSSSSDSPSSSSSSSNSPSSSSSSSNSPSSSSSSSDSPSSSSSSSVSPSSSSSSSVSPLSSSFSSVSSLSSPEYSSSSKSSSSSDRTVIYITSSPSSSSSPSRMSSPEFYQKSERSLNSNQSTDDSTSSSSISPKSSPDIFQKCRILFFSNTSTNDSSSCSSPESFQRSRSSLFSIKSSKDSLSYSSTSPISSPEIYHKPYQTFTPYEQNSSLYTYPYLYPFPFYQSPYWGSNVNPIYTQNSCSPVCYQSSTPVKEEIKDKPRKLTDFSIRAITGCK